MTEVRNSADSAISTAVSEDEFHAAMKRADTVALWEWNDARSNEPSQSEPAFHLRWQDVEPLFD